MTQVKELRVQNPVNLPLDPLHIKSMAEYNFALLTMRTWFEFTADRKLLPGIVERWGFDSDTGTYTFTISSTAKWSDGSQISASDLKFNLDRAVYFQTSYGHSISALMNLSTYRELSPTVFQITTSDERPAPSFFERMGSIFLAIVSPTDVDAVSYQVRSSQKSSGPYVVQSSDSETTVMIRNPVFGETGNTADKIVLGNKSMAFDIDSFLAGTSWENLSQFTSFVPSGWEEKIKKHQLPFWTRGHDRVSLLRPAYGGKEGRGRQIIKAINSLFTEHRDAMKLPFNVERSYSLQPDAYPLHHEKVACENCTFPEGNIKILAPESPAFDFHKEVLNDFFHSKGVEVIWDPMPFSQYVEVLANTENHDIIFLNFGVADPEPATWVSLIRDAKFVSFETSDLNEIESILKVEGKFESIRLFKKLLENVMKKGGYAPLYYGSTFAIGHKDMSFKQVGELDETVDLAKVIIESKR